MSLETGEYCLCNYVPETLQPMHVFRHQRTDGNELAPKSQLRVVLLGQPWTAIEELKRNQKGTSVEISHLPGACELIELPRAWEDHKPDFRIAEDCQLLGFLDQPFPPLREGHLPARGVVDPADHDLSPPHTFSLSLSWRSLSLKEPISRILDRLGREIC